MTRFDVRSVDGASIAVWVDGTGPPLVLVHGSMADHTTFEAFITVLGKHFTTFAMDRRGFGASGDIEPYAVEREFEDVAAVAAAVAARAGGAVALWGHSYGANCAMGGAALTDKVARLILYEPSLGLSYPQGSIDAIEAALARGDNEAAVVAVLVDILELSDHEIDVMRAAPIWPIRLAAAPTIPRECRVEDGWVYEPGQFDAIAAPALMLVGSESVPGVIQATQRAATAIRTARIHWLAGHGHFAHKTDPELVTSIVRDFVGARDPLARDGT